MFIGIADKLFNHVLTVKIIGKFHHLLEVIQLRAVIVCISEGKLQDETTQTSLLEIGCHAERIFRNKDVWSDATSAIDNTAVTCMISRSCMLDAIL